MSMAAALDQTFEREISASRDPHGNMRTLTDAVSVSRNFNVFLSF
jgi:hypothetical protein